MLSFVFSDRGIPIIRVQYTIIPYNLRNLYKAVTTGVEGVIKFFFFFNIFATTEIQIMKFLYEISSEI